jgi:hypothetical protein
MFDPGEFATRWIQETLPPNFRGGVITVQTPNPDHPRAGRISRRRQFGIYDEMQETAGKILGNLREGSMTIEQAADHVRELRAEYHIRVCVTKDDLISAIEQIVSSRVNAWNNGGKHAWDDHGYFVNTFWRE